ncbi:MAG TPA: hypothetical protein PKW15_03635 [Alphaproteobacteria bacterium]|nr:hypothetical protein [Rhodospirillaceae bacterium]HRJ12318.1 hypothetical protein [Alphaproteobacteria bacterium]
MIEYIILTLLVLIAWELFFAKYKIILSSPIFRNTETKELGCWAYLSMRIPFAPFPGLIIHDGKGTILRIREIEWDKSEKTINCRTYYDQHICVDSEQYEHTKKIAAEWGWKLREVPSGHILSQWKDEFEK